MASTDDRFGDELPAQHRAESESDHSAEVQLLASQPNITFVQPVDGDVLTARSVKPVIAQHKVADAGVFEDIEEGPVFPTCWDQDPTVATCPSCRTTSMTVTKSRLTRTSVFFGGFPCMACGLCVLALFCPCCKDVQHCCRNCGSKLGRRSAL